MELIAVVVYWCLATAPVDSFDPHQTGAVARFVRANPATCHATFGDVLSEPNLTIATCRSQAMIRYMPGWQQKNEGRLFLAADCVPYHPAEKIDMQALKDKMAPP